MEELIKDNNLEPENDSESVCAAPVEAAETDNAVVSEQETNDVESADVENAHDTEDSDIDAEIDTIVSEEIAELVKMAAAEVEARKELKNQVQQEENKKSRRKALETVQLIGCRIFGVITILAMFCVFFMGFTYGYHTTLEMTEISFLQEQGYYRLSSAGDYKLNIYKIGNSLSPYKVICLSGLGINDYGMRMSLVHNELKDEVQFVYVDRAGYGASDDTAETQTIERIVDDYRKALKNAGLNPPYVLMPHSFSGVYATYWQSKYPEEIKGIVFLDGTYLNSDSELDDKEVITRTDELWTEIAQLGFYRYDSSYIDELPACFSEKDIELSKIMQLQSVATYANLSEQREYAANYQKACAVLVATEIPKIYISSIVGFQTREEVKDYFDWDYNKAVKVEYSDERADKLIAQCAETREWLMPYIDNLGNTELVYLPGDHCIFMQKPVELANIIRDFLYSLDGER